MLNRAILIGRLTKDPDMRYSPSGVACTTFTLADALRYGYVIDEPIRVEITAEMQEQIKTWYEAHQEDADSHYRIGFVTALGLCGIKIIVVNE